MSHLYTEEFLMHVEKTMNVGDIENPDGVGETSAVTCGDTVRIMILVGDGKIKDIKFKVYGCAAAIAGGSLITHIAKGMSIEEAERISADDLVTKFRGVPEKKIQCLENVVNALRAAIGDYYSKTES